jgi:hypothetical protein
MQKRDVQYEPMLVTYVDILGFEDLVREKSANDISRILRVFNEETAPAKFKHDVPDMPKQEHVSFSDLNMTCTRLRGSGNRGIVFNQFLRLVHAQSILLLDEGIPIRGGIAVGPATRSYRKYYGPAVIQAYRLEQRKPGPPRILVDPSVLHEIENNPLLWMHDKEDELKTAKSFLAYDDGVAHIDYLRIAIGEAEDSAWVVEQHDMLINERLARYAKREYKHVREKYEWLRRYHDRTVRSLKKATAKPR